MLKPFRRIWFASLNGGHLSTQFDTASIGAGVIVAGQMVSDSVEPGTERARITIALRIADEPEECFLNEIFGQVCIGQNPI